MQQKYAIIYPACHGGNFLGELLTLGEDCYSCNTNLLESTTTDRLTAYTARYTAPGDWIANEIGISDFRNNHRPDSAKVDLIQKHVYDIKLSNHFKIIVADAFGTRAGAQWAEVSRYQLFSMSDRHGMHHDEDKHYDILKNSNLPMLCVDMTQFLDHTFPVTYYESLCQQLGIIPISDSAIELHRVWHQCRVKNYQDYCSIATETHPLLWSTQRQQILQDRYLLRYNAAVKNNAKMLEETYNNIKGPNWPTYNTSDNFFDQLPDQIKQELQHRKINWSDLGIPKINNYTELAVKYGYPVDPYYQYTYIVPNLLFINQSNL